MSSDGTAEDRSSFETEAKRASGSSLIVRWLWRLTATAAWLLAATALVPLLPVDWWWVRIGDYPRLQLLLAYTVALVALLPFWRRRLAQALLALMLVCCGIQLFWVFPYLPFAPVEVQRAESADPALRLRVLTANVLQDNDDAGPLLKLIQRHRPDIVVVCEVNDR